MGVYDLSHSRFDNFDFKTGPNADKLRTILKYRSEAELVFGDGFNLVSDYDQQKIRDLCRDVYPEGTELSQCQYFKKKILSKTAEDFFPACKAWVQNQRRF